MSAVSYNPLPLGADDGHSLGSSRITAIFHALRSEWRARRAARSVEALSDGMLHDIGLTRGEIDQAVRYGSRHRG